MRKLTLFFSLATFIFMGLTYWTWKKLNISPLEPTLIRLSLDNIVETLDPALVRVGRMPVCGDIPNKKQDADQQDDVCHFLDRAGFFSFLLRGFLLCSLVLLFFFVCISILFHILR